MHDGSRGFSLVEVMVVVAIIGVVTALALPSISTAVRRANEPAQLLRVHGFITEARNLARRTNQCVGITRDADGAGLSSQPVVTCAIAADCRCRASVLAAKNARLELAGAAPAVVVKAFVGNTSVLPELTSVATGEQLLFLPDGSTPYSDVVFIEVALPERGIKRLSVLPASGIVRVLQ